MDVLVIGQSNAGNWFHDITFSAAHPNALSWRGGAWNSVRGEGAVTFSSTLATASGQPVRLLSTAEGNTSLTPVQGANWLATGPDSLYGKTLAAVAASGLKPDAIIWIQGERDAQFRVGTDAYRAGLETLHQRLAADFGDVPLLMQPLVLPQTGMEAIVAAQQAFAAAHANVTMVTPSVELLTRDLLHFTPAGYNVLADLMARAVLAELSLPSAAPITFGTSGTDAANRIYAGSADNLVDALGGNDVVLGEQGNDRLNGGAGADVISGGTGDDTLAGGPGADLLVGDAGADNFVFSEAPSGDRITDFATGVDKLVFQGLDRITFSGGNVYHNGQLVVTVQGRIASGDIVIDVAPAPPPPPPPPPPTTGVHRVGTSAADTLTGGNANDTLDGGAGRDSLAGGLGDDTFIVTSGDRLSDTGGIDHVVSNASWTLGAGFEHLKLTGTANIRGTGNALDNRIVGNARNDTLNGLDGHDTLFGAEGSDRLAGGAGNDRLDGRQGNDRLEGGTGADRYAFSWGPGASNADTILGFVSGSDKIVLLSTDHINIGASGDFAAGDDRFMAGAGFSSGREGSDRVVYDTATGRLYYDADGFGAGAAQLVATLAGAPVLRASDLMIEGPSTFAGTAGADAMVGTDGEDVMASFDGNDTLVGAWGNDTLMGGSGNDWLDGRQGNDRLEGGVGADRFAFTWGPSADNADTIVGFASGTDKIVLSASDHPNIGAPGDFATGDDRFMAGPGFTSGQEGSDRVVYNTSSGNLYYDADGSGDRAAVLIATLEGAPSISAADFAVM